MNQFLQTPTIEAMNVKLFSKLAIDLSKGLHKFKNCVKNSFSQSAWHFSPN